jgi:DNA-binding CsgD family transcriptional regulator
MKHDLRSQLKGFSLAWIARELNLSRHTLYAYVSGSRTIPDGMIDKLREITKREIKI